MKRALAAALFGLCVASGAAPVAAAEPPPSAEKLAAARKLFAEALKDEQEHRYEAALEKLRAVQQTKSTLSVRYRIASCEEGLGQLRSALADFRAIGAAVTSDAEEQGVVKSAQERTGVLEARIPELRLQLSARAPSDAVVTVDAEPVTGGALRGDPILLDPGEHEVRARAAGAAPFASKVSVREQARVALEIPLDPASPPAAPAAAPAAGGGATADPTTREAPRDRSLGYVLLGTAGAFAVATVVTAVLRKGEIDKLTGACPGGQCPASRQDELTSSRSRALAEGPLALVFAGVAALTGAAGVYFVVAPSGGAPKGPTATLGLDGVRGAF